MGKESKVVKEKIQEMIKANPVLQAKFTQQFPSLKNFTLDCSDLSMTVNMDEIVKKVLNKVAIEIEEQLTKHCLDKKLTRDRIYNVIDRWDLKTVEKMQLEEALFKELGL